MMNTLTSKYTQLYDFFVNLSTTHKLLQPDPSKTGIDNNSVELNNLINTHVTIIHTIYAIVTFIYFVLGVVTIIIISIMSSQHQDAIKVMTMRIHNESNSLQTNINTIKILSIMAFISFFIFAILLLINLTNIFKYTRNYVLSRGTNYVLWMEYSATWCLGLIIILIHLGVTYTFDILLIIGVNMFYIICFCCVVENSYNISTNIKFDRHVNAITFFTCGALIFVLVTVFLVKSKINENIQIQFSIITRTILALITISTNILILTLMMARIQFYSKYKTIINRKMETDVLHRDNLSGLQTPIVLSDEIFAVVSTQNDIDLHKTIIHQNAQYERVKLITLQSTKIGIIIILIINLLTL